MVRWLSSEEEDPDYRPSQCPEKQVGVEVRKEKKSQFKFVIILPYICILVQKLLSLHFKTFSILEEKCLGYNSVGIRAIKNK